MPMFTDPAPKDGDTAEISARKSNQVLFTAHSAALGNPPFPGGLSTLEPRQGDSLVTSLKKINAILYLSA